MSFNFLTKGKYNEQAQSIKFKKEITSFRSKISLVWITFFKETEKI